MIVRHILVGACSLNGNPIRDDGIQALVDGLLKLHNFRLSDEEKVSEDELKVSTKSGIFFSCNN